MPSVFVLDGVTPKPKRSRKRAKRVDATLGDAPPVIGSCKTVKNSKTGCEMQLCYIGLGARTAKGKPSRTGWEFQKGSSRCSRR